VEQIALAKPRPPGRIFRAKILWLAMLPLLIGRPARAAEEYEVKAAFLLNFTKFVVWPPDTFADAHSPLAICVLGDDPFGNTLDEIVKGEAVNGHVLTVQRIHAAPESKACQVLYFAGSERAAAKILTDLGPGTLTVGEGDKFLRQGGAIAFVLQDRRVRFDIDQGAAARAKLMLSSRLMMVARTVVR
jgi:YfiR/HmsC-like